jgi:DNA-binding CsgD family transcriptional regulator/PAS domain-containing protein
LSIDTDENHLHDAIGLVYDSALDKSQWPLALKAMARLVDACTGEILVHDTARREIKMATQWNEIEDWPKWQRQFDETYAPLMPFFASLPKFEIGAVHNTADMARMSGRTDDYYQDRFFQEWAFPAGLRDTMASTLIKSPNRYATFTMHTSIHQDLVGPEQLMLAARLVPHVRRAVTIGDLLQTTTAAVVTLHSALDQLSAAVLVTDADGHIIHCNRAGEVMLGEQGPLGYDTGQVRARQADATKVLLDAIRLTQDPFNKIGSRGVDVPLRFADGRPAIAHVLPLEPGRRNRDGGPRATAAIFVASAEHALPAAESLIALYGLTTMEARVLMQIASGKNRLAAAAALGIADSTAKSHLERVFSKTETNDQAALARLVTSLTSAAH